MAEGRGTTGQAGGDPSVNFVLPHLRVQAACTCKTSQMENPDCEVHGGDDDSGRRATPLEVLTEARLPSRMVTMEDGYPSIVQRSREEAAQVALDALEAAGYRIVPWAALRG